MTEDKPSGEAKKSTLSTALMYPALLLVVGFGFNWYLDKTKRLEIGEKVIERLFVDKPIDSFAADALLDDVVDDQKLLAKFHQYTLDTWKRRLQDAVRANDTDTARKIADAATTVGKNVGQQVLADVGKSSAPQIQQLQQSVSQSPAPSSTTSSQNQRADPRALINPGSIPDSKPLSGNLNALASILPDIKAAESKTVTSVQNNPWIYLGVTNAAGAWSKKNFSADGAPDTPLNENLEGKQIRIATDIYLRTVSPVYSEQSGWRLGDVQGVLKEGAHASIQAVQEVPGTGNTRLWWARITVQ